MPFDGQNFPQIEVPTVKPFDFNAATHDERLLELARNLDDEQAWRDKLMEWDFTTIDSESPVCGTAGCAIGLARKLWPMFGYGEMAFGITEGEWAELFSQRLSERLGIDMADVLPSMVATAIREFVAKRTANHD